jgi:hypothetical protein
MKAYNHLICLIVFTALIAVSGCNSLLPNSASPANVAVQSGIASTNDSAVVADLKELQAVNKAVNPTPTEPLVDSALTFLAFAATAFGGWYARHHTAQAQLAAATAADPPPATPAKQS